MLSVEVTDGKDIGEEGERDVELEDAVLDGQIPYRRTRSQG